MARTYAEHAAPAGSVHHASMWLAAAALLGFAVPAIFSLRLHWERSLFVVPYVAVIGAFVGVFLVRTGVALRELTRAWALGLAGAAAVGTFVVANVLGQPGSARPEGAPLVWALIWLGLAYGLADALFLNVMPTLAVQGAGFLDTQPGWRLRLSRGSLALIASGATAAAYHLGFAEFHGQSLIAPIFGNVIITLGYVVTRSPLAAIGAHVAMHVAAVLHGAETVVQLPPHY
jgi:hypothetical protein